MPFAAALIGQTPMAAVLLRRLSTEEAELLATDASKVIASTAVVFDHLVALRAHLELNATLKRVGERLALFLSGSEVGGAVMFV